MRSLLRIFACWCGAALLSLPLVAQQLPDQMSPPRLVNDFAGLLDEAQRRSLEQKLADFDRETSTQITVVTVDDLDGYAPADYAQRLHDKWGVGRKGKDNGILILVKPSQPRFPGRSLHFGGIRPGRGDPGYYRRADFGSGDDPGVSPGKRL